MRAARNAEHAARAGADAVCAVPPFFVRPGDGGIVDYYKTVAEAADLPLFVYNLPSGHGSEYYPRPDAAAPGQRAAPHRPQALRASI